MDLKLSCCKGYHLPLASLWRIQCWSDKSQEKFLGHFYLNPGNDVLVVNAVSGQRISIQAVKCQLMEQCVQIVNLECLIGINKI